jgi:hypothetical protein
MRKSDFFLIFLAFTLLLFGLMVAHASFRTGKDISLLNEKRNIVKKLELTDLCLFTEASYTRHLTQADLHTPFQDYPVSLEHFPSGSIVRPPFKK